jgi:hypothetical protein
VLRPPSEFFTPCTPERVKDNTVRALARAYAANTYEVWKCNNRISDHKKWFEKQEKIYGNGNK